MPAKPDALAKQQRKNLQIVCNRVLSAWSFKTLKTWQDVYNIIGTPPNPHSCELTYPILKGYLESLKDDLERRIKEAETQATIGASLAQAKAAEVVSSPNRNLGHVDIQIKTISPATLSENPTADESGFSNNDDYGLPDNPNHKAFLFWFQKKAVVEILTGFLGFDVTKALNIADLKEMFQKNRHLANPKRGLLLLAATGTGKTFITGAVVRYLFDIGFHDEICFGPVPYLYVTRATIVEQTRRVFENIFCLRIKDGVEILNIEQLRSRAGGLWIKDEQVIEDGKEKRKWSWRRGMSPCVILWDESQALKNEGTTQHEIGAAYNAIPTDTYQLFISATPFTRVCEAKCFAVSTRKPISDQLGLGTVTTLKLENWPTYASAIASPAMPTEYVEAAVERLTKDLDKYIVRVRGVRPQFDAVNRIEKIRFATPEERQYYEEAYERYLAEKAKLEAAGLDDTGTANGNSRFQILVQFLKFRMAAEFCRRHHLAKLMFDAVQNGKAAVAALNFKQTIIGVTRILVEEYGVSRDLISLVWGGGQTGLTKKQKMKASIKEKAEQLEAAGIDATELLAELELENVEDRIIEDLPEHLRLGPQSKEDRQREIDRFQSGRSLYCMYSFRAGGVGLSLHHTDELTKNKVKRQKNGYAVVSDIPNIPVRPRINFVAPTYSAIELVQGLGRCPRLTSLSDTEQILLFYAGTIEDEVARVVSQKLRCLSKVVRQKEKWADVVVGGVKAEAHLDDNITEEKGTNYDDLSSAEDEEEE